MCPIFTRLGMVTDFDNGLYVTCGLNYRVLNEYILLASSSSVPSPSPDFAPHQDQVFARFCCALDTKAPPRGVHRGTRMCQPTAADSELGWNAILSSLMPARDAPPPTKKPTLSDRLFKFKLLRLRVALRSPHSACPSGPVTSCRPCRHRPWGAWRPFPLRARR